MKKTLTIHQSYNDIQDFQVGNILRSEFGETIRVLEKPVEKGPTEHDEALRIWDVVCEDVE